jgi:MinD superfamily P-loop ATPase
MERRTALGPLIHAALGIAQDNSGKLVAQVRQEARNAAERDGIELILVDGPPGIGCPVHASLTGCDLALVVTEPTPSGEHDLERVLELLDHFAVPAAVLINKHDLSPEFTARIETLARRAGARVVGKLPFSPEVPRALARGELPLAVEAVATPLAEAWERIVSLLFTDDGKGKRALGMEALVKKPFTATVLRPAPRSGSPPAPPGRPAGGPRRSSARHG